MLANYGKITSIADICKSHYDTDTASRLAQRIYVYLFLGKTKDLLHAYANEI